MSLYITTLHAWWSRAFVSDRIEEAIHRGSPQLELVREGVPDGDIPDRAVCIPPCGGSSRGGLLWDDNGELFFAGDGPVVDPYGEEELYSVHRVVGGVFFDRALELIAYVA